MSTLTLFGQVVAQVVAPAAGGGWRAWTLGDWVVAIVVAAALLAILLVALRGMGVELSPWLRQIGLIVLVAVVAVLAVRLVLSL